MFCVCVALYQIGKKKKNALKNRAFFTALSGNFHRTIVYSGEQKIFSSAPVY
jgi:hypothetical protein